MRLMVVSPPCIEPTNRAVYRRLATHHGIDVHLVMPRRYRVGAGFQLCGAVDREPFAVTLLEPAGGNPRLFMLKGLSDVIRAEQPSHVLVDGDPATVLVKQVAEVKSKQALTLWVMTAENFERRYLREMVSCLARFRARVAVGRLLTWSMWRLIRHVVDRVFTISRRGTLAMTRMGFEGRVTQIPLGFDPELFHVQDSERITTTRTRLGLHAPTVAYFGRLVPEKGVDILLGALAKLSDLRWQFLVDQFSSYRTPYTRELASQAQKLGIADRVVYFDAKHDEMPDYMNAADFIVLPSRVGPMLQEQYGRVIPEAMACGKVVIGSDSGAIPELIGDAGFVVPAGDVEALSQTSRMLITASDERLLPIRQKAERRAHENLSIARQAEIWSQLLMSDTARQRGHDRDPAYKA